VAAAAKIVKEAIDIEGLHRACLKAVYDMPLAISSPQQALIPIPTQPQHHPHTQPQSPKSKSQGNSDFSTGISQSRKSLTPLTPGGVDRVASGMEKPRIGIIRDSAFQFYYPDNLEALEAFGAELCYISPLRENRIPQVDAIYMGGGFPETHAPQLAANKEFAENLRQLAVAGLPIYAECGGFIFLGQSLMLDGVTYPMAGVIPVKFGLSKRPVGHGYTRVRVIEENPYFKVGEIIRGHEFRYSTVVEIDQSVGSMAFSMERGKGIVGCQDGFFFDRVFATYTHILATGTPSWAESILRQARIYQASRVI
jgi:cobyrinic acid a,c-diamide synthase